MDYLKWITFLFQFDGDGIYFFANGDRYEGQFRSGSRQGAGLMFFMNGGYRYFRDKISLLK